jgi:predicted ferric reductase
VPAQPLPGRRHDFRGLRAAAWIALYLLLVAFPLLVLLVGPVPRGGGRWWDFSMALGFAGLAMLGVQFVLTARFRRATAPFGIDIIYYFHRWTAVGAVGLIVAHYLILRTRYPDALGSASPLTAPWPLTAGRLALLIFVGLIVSSLWRKQLRLDYDRWRIWHGLLAVAAVAFAIGHIAGVGYYTAAPWKRAVWTGYSVLWLLVLGYIRVVKPLRLLRKPCRVTEVRAERGDSWTLTLQPEGPIAPSFRPGQFAWLTLGTSPFRAREHPFSFSGTAADPKCWQFTIKELGDFTRTVGNTRIGTIAYVDGPHGVFTSDHYADAPGFVLIAGGIGIAPVMSMLRTFADRGDPRPLLLLYGNGHWERVTFREEIEALRSRLNLEVVHVLKHPPPDWRGITGLLSEPVLRQVLPDRAREHVFFVCGPKAMTQSTQRSLRSMGIPLRRIHFELFDMV